MKLALQALVIKTFSSTKWVNFCRHIWCLYFHQPVVSSPRQGRSCHRRSAVGAEAKEDPRVDLQAASSAHASREASEIHNLECKHRQRSSRRENVGICCATRMLFADTTENGPFKFWATNQTPNPSGVKKTEGRYGFLRNWMHPSLQDPR